MAGTPAAKIIGVACGAAAEGELPFKKFIWRIAAHKLKG